MPIDEAIQARIEAISTDVMALVADQGLSLTEKNRRMKPLIDEKQVLEKTLTELTVIKQTDYSGKCSG